MPAPQQLFEGNRREKNDNMDGIAWELLRATRVWERNREGQRPWAMDQMLCQVQRPPGRHGEVVWIGPAAVV